MKCNNIRDSEMNQTMILKYVRALMDHLNDPWCTKLKALNRWSLNSVMFQNRNPFLFQILGG